MIVYCQSFSRTHTYMLENTNRFQLIKLLCEHLWLCTKQILWLHVVVSHSPTAASGQTHAHTQTHKRDTSTTALSEKRELELSLNSQSVGYVNKSSTKSKILRVRFRSVPETTFDLHGDIHSGAALPTSKVTNAHKHTSF